jgi:hypothetical protein
MVGHRSSAPTVRRRMTVVQVWWETGPLRQLLRHQMTVDQVWWVTGPLRQLYAVR